MEVNTLTPAVVPLALGIPMISMGAGILHVTASVEWRTKLPPTIRSIPLLDLFAVPQKYEAYAGNGSGGGTSFWASYA